MGLSGGGWGLTEEAHTFLHGKSYVSIIVGVFGGGATSFCVYFPSFCAGRVDGGGGRNKGNWA